MADPDYQADEREVQQYPYKSGDMGGDVEDEHNIPFFEVHEIVVPHLGHVPIAKGDFHRLPRRVQRFIAYYVDLMKPRGLYICDGTQKEAEEVTHKLLERGTLERLTALENCYICRTDPADVARVESKTFISTKKKHDVEPRLAPGVETIMAHWHSPEQALAETSERFPGCMAGRMMYVIPFSMGPLGSRLSKIGVQLTDSNYVLLCMRTMARVSDKVWEILGEGDFVKCIHSMGCPRPWRKKVINHWPCNPEKILIAHFPEERKVKSYGSGYGGNSLLGKKCFALRIASVIARDEGWMAEHMLIMGVEDPQGREHYLAAAFPSACGKTNLAMIKPGLPGFKVLCVGDDIAWMRFDENGVLHGINPEAGFFGVAPGTNWKTNYNAMAALQKNSIFTNVAKRELPDGGTTYYWEGLEDELQPEDKVTSWLGEPWKKGDPKKSAHPNSRFACPAAQCPIIHPKWEDPTGVPIEAMIFGGRRPEGVPLVYEAFNWNHGVMIGAQLKSETTAAAEFKGKAIMHDPMAMRPFMGYNFGHYLQHWLNLNKPPHKVPKIFHVNWFRVDKNGKFLWPGFGDNVRVLDWICKRIRNEDVGYETPIGIMPKKGTIDMSGLGDIDWDELFSLPKDYWVEDAKETLKFLQEQVGEDLPKEILEECLAQQKRIEAM